MQIDEHQTVDGLLNALELGKYAIIFKAEEVSCNLWRNLFDKFSCSD